MSADGATEDEGGRTFPGHPPIPPDRIVKRGTEYHRKMHDQKQNQPIRQGKRNHGISFATGPGLGADSGGSVDTPGLLHNTTPVRGAPASSRRQPWADLVSRRSTSGHPLDCVNRIDRGTPVESNCISIRADQAREVQLSKFRSIPENRRDSQPSGNNMRGSSFSEVRGGKTLPAPRNNSALVSDDILKRGSGTDISSTLAREGGGRKAISGRED